jgi:hypothetical protein
MEYQKRLRLINYVKTNFTVKKNEMIAIHFSSLDSLDSVAAEKIDSLDGDFQLWSYFHDREKMHLGYCLILNNCQLGPYIDFKDDYLSFQEHYEINFCVNNSIEETMNGHRIETINEVDQLIRQLNGKKPTYYKSNC